MTKKNKTNLVPVGHKNDLLAIGHNKNVLQVKDAAWNSLSEESKKAYSSDYKLFFDFVGKDPKNITADDILKFIDDLEKKDYKNNTINRKIASISKMFKVMVIAGEIKQNPVDVLKQFRNINFKTSKNIHLGLTIDDIKKVVKVTKNTTTQDKKIILIIRMLAMTGLRISEFTGIRNKDILNFDKDNQVVSIVGKGKKERQIYLSNIFIEEIRKLYPVTEKSEYLFYNRLYKRYDRRVLWLQLKTIFHERIGKDAHPHMLRHFFATYKINVEKQDIKAVSKFLGHSDVSITLNAYVDTALDVKNSKIKI